MTICFQLNPKPCWVLDMQNILTYFLILLYNSFFIIFLLIPCQLWMHNCRRYEPLTCILTLLLIILLWQVRHWFYHCRSGIAYISNVAVRETFRRKGIAKRLIVKAEAQARSWGCRAVALHCDLNNPGATKLYKGQGFKCIKVPEGANWPQPKTSPDIQFGFMMKLLNTSSAA